jgi:hypothetical protein
MLFMLIMITVMFALGIIALALNTSLTYQQFTFDLSPTSGMLWSPRHTNTIMATGATIICTIVSGASPPPLSIFYYPNRTNRADFYLCVSSLCVSSSLLSATSSVHGERLYCGTMIGGSSASSLYMVGGLQHEGGMGRREDIGVRRGGICRRLLFCLVS